MHVSINNSKLLGPLKFWWQFYLEFLRQLLQDAYPGMHIIFFQKKVWIILTQHTKFAQFWFEAIFLRLEMHPLKDGATRAKLHFDHCRNKIQIFVFFALPIGLYRLLIVRGSEVTMGSEDPLQNIFLRAYLFKRGKVEHILTVVNLKLKPSLFIPRPTVHVYRAYVGWV